MAHSPMRRSAYTSVILLALLPAACGSDKTPEILRGVSAGGGYWGACPPPQWVPKNDRLAISPELDRKSTRLNSSHSQISYAVFCLKKKNNASHGPDSTNNRNHSQYADCRMQS